MYPGSVLRCRQENGEVAPNPRIAGYQNPAAVGLDDGLDDAQPQAATVAAPDCRRPVKPFEDPLPVGGTDADAGVLDLNSYWCSGPRRTQQGFAPSGG